MEVYYLNRRWQYWACLAGPEGEVKAGCRLRGKNLCHRSFQVGGYHPLGFQVAKTGGVGGV